MKQHLTDQQLVQLSKQCLDESITTMDTSETHRLQKARQLALQQHIPSQSYKLQWIGGMVTAMFLISVFWFNVKHPTASVEDDLLLVEDIIYTEENLDLLNNLEFYKWLEERNKQGELV